MHFIQYTNVRRYILQYLNVIDGSLVMFVLKNLPEDILVFILTDPCLADALPEAHALKPVLLGHYSAFVKELEASKPETFEGMLDWMVLPSAYQAVYGDSPRELKCGEAVVEHV